jgi:hypothetical protein
MKIRNGFVSNSSSSSFTCDVCGTTESGMDASPGDFDMSNCVNGHTFCNDHASKSEELTPRHYRDTIIKSIEQCTWLEKEKKQADIAEMEMVPDDEIEEFYNDNYSDGDVLECQCPICTFKALDKNDGFKYLKKKFSMDDKEILEAIQVHFKKYIDFKNFLSNENKK